MLILPVGLSMVTNDPVSICGWISFGTLGSNLSVQVVIGCIDEIFSQFHVSNRVDVFSQFKPSADFANTELDLIELSFVKI